MRDGIKLAVQAGVSTTSFPGKKGNVYAIDVQIVRNGAASRGIAAVADGKLLVETGGVTYLSEETAGGELCLYQVDGHGLKVMKQRSGREPQPIQFLGSSGPILIPADLTTEVQAALH